MLMCIAKRPLVSNGTLILILVREVLEAPCLGAKWGGVVGEGGGVLLIGCLTFQQHASVSQGRICSDNCTRCNTEIEVADQTFYLTQS